MGKSIMYLLSNIEVALKKVRKKKRKTVLIQDMFHIDGMPEASVDFKETHTGFCKDTVN